MNEQQIRRLVTEVVQQLLPAAAGRDTVPVEVSGRHVHLSQNDVDVLFGQGYILTPQRFLSQPGQFLAQERINIIAERGEFRNVAILGPARGRTQVEISLSDAHLLGLTPPVRQSGDTADCPAVYLLAGTQMLKACSSVIVAQSHIHMTPAEAADFGVRDGQRVQVALETARPVTFNNVLIRVREDFALAMHIDFDEANACAWQEGAAARICGVTGETTDVGCSYPAVAAEAAARGCSEPSPQGDKSTAKAQPTDSRLITAERAGDLARTCDGTLRLHGKTLITPLARDVLRAQKINIVWEETDRC